MSHSCLQRFEKCARLSRRMVACCFDHSFRVISRAFIGLLYKGRSFLFPPFVFHLIFFFSFFTWSPPSFNFSFSFYFLCFLSFLFHDDVSRSRICLVFLVVGASYFGTQKRKEFLFWIGEDDGDAKCVEPAGSWIHRLSLIPLLSTWPVFRKMGVPSKAYIYVRYIGRSRGKSVFATGVTAVVNPVRIMCCQTCRRIVLENDLLDVFSSSYILFSITSMTF